MPTLLHRDASGKRLGSCARKTEVTEAAQTKADQELWKSWRLFRKKMQPIRNGIEMTWKKNRQIVTY